MLGHRAIRLTAANPFCNERWLVGILQFIQLADRVMSDHQIALCIRGYGVLGRLVGVLWPCGDQRNYFTLIRFVSLLVIVVAPKLSSLRRNRRAFLFLLPILLQRRGQIYPSPQRTSAFT